MSAEKKSFFGNYIGHIITILVYLATYAYFVGNHAKTLEQHSKAIETLSVEIKEVKKEVGNITVNGTAASKANAETISHLESRLAQTEKVVNKIEVLANDMEWFKKFLLAESEKKSQK